MNKKTVIVIAVTAAVTLILRNQILGLPVVNKLPTL